MRIASIIEIDNAVVTSMCSKIFWFNVDFRLLKGLCEFKRSTVCGAEPFPFPNNMRVTVTGVPLNAQSSTIPLGSSRANDFF